MHDIRTIRDDPEAFDAALARRGAPPAAAALVADDQRRRALATELQTALARRNEASKAIGAAKARKAEDEAAALMAEVAALKDRLPALEAEEKAAGEALTAALAALPNLPAADVPDGADEAGNVVGVVTSGGFSPSLGKPIAMGFAPPALADVGTRLKVIVRGKAQAAEVAAMPFVPHRYVRKL